MINQSYTNIEIIIVNDGSTDDSIKFIEPYLDNPRIKYFTQINKGLGEARNVGIRNASGTLITFVDSDDWVDLDLYGMFFLDRMRDKNGADIYRTKTKFRYPIQKDRQGNYKIKSGEMIRVCMTSDFFLEEADAWRDEAWEIMSQRRDVKFFLLTKRPERVADHLPYNWGEGWENIFFNVTTENQQRADERIPILLDLPFRHKGIMCAPFIGPVSIRKYLEYGQIEQVLCDGARPCNYDWVKSLRQECVDFNVTFVFCGTGRRFLKDGRLYKIEGNGLQSQQAYRSGMSYRGKPIHFDLYDDLGYPIPDDRLHVPNFRERCQTCVMKIICNGCSDCGSCEKRERDR